MSCVLSLWIHSLVLQCCSLFTYFSPSFVSINRQSLKNLGIITIKGPCVHLHNKCCHKMHRTRVSINPEINRDLNNYRMHRLRKPLTCKCSIRAIQRIKIDYSFYISLKLDLFILLLAFAYSSCMLIPSSEVAVACLTR